MRNFYSRTNYVFYLFVAFILIFHSCTDDAEPESKSYNKVSQISAEFSKNLFDLLGESDLKEMIKYSVDIYNYKYPINYKGNTITASGLICVPLNEGHSFPVISFQRGTIVAHHEAPSLSYQTVQNMAIESIASMGFVVVIPDEIGFGESSNYFHPYLVKEPNVLAVTEMLKNIQEIPDGDLSGVSLNDSLFLLGYSHGGWVTMATLAELEASNQDSWNIIATACGAGPYYPEMVMDFALSNDTYNNPFYMSYVVLSYLDDGSISNELTDFYQQPYAGIIPGLYDGSKTGKEINAQLTSVNVNLYTSNFINNYPDGYSDLNNAVEINKIDAWLNKSPILLIHGENDVDIPKSVSDKMYQSFQDLGSDLVEYQVIPLADHGGAAAPAIRSSIVWFDSFK